LGECVRLDIADVDLLQGQLLVRNGKGKKDRVVPVPHRALVALDAYLRDARPAFVKDRRVSALFTSWMGQALKPVTLVSMLKRRAKAARLPVSLSPHVLRHSCATHLLKGGADVRHVQEILGHAHLDSTMRYTRVAVTDLHKVIERSHPREREWARRCGQRE
jgi:integrase/recombinase XerD